MRELILDSSNQADSVDADDRFKTKGNGDMAVTISICIPDEVHKQYEMLAQATGRMPNDLMVEALCAMVVWQLREIALIQEGVSQSHARLGIPIKDVIAEFKARGMLPAGFELGVGVDAPGS